MNQSIASAAQRHIAELETRVAQQGALVEALLAAERDAGTAKRTLRVLEDALALTREHLRFVLREPTPVPQA